MGVRWGGGGTLTFRPLDNGYKDSCKSFSLFLKAEKPLVPWAYFFPKALPF